MLIQEYDPSNSYTGRCGEVRGYLVSTTYRVSIVEGAYNYPPSPPLTRLHTYTAKYNPQKLLVKYENTSSHVQETNKKDLLVFSVIILTPPL